MKIGLIQSRGIGDIIIGLPIAKYFVDQGHVVLWPINEEFMSSFVNAAPYVEFLPVKRGVGPGGCSKSRSKISNAEAARGSFPSTIASPRGRI